MADFWGTLEGASAWSKKRNLVERGIEVRIKKNNKQEDIGRKGKIQTEM